MKYLPSPLPVPLDKATRTLGTRLDHSFLTFRTRSIYEITFSRHNLSTNQPFLSPPRPKGGLCSLPMIPCGVLRGHFGCIVSVEDDFSTFQRPCLTAWSEFVLFRFFWFALNWYTERTFQAIYVQLRGSLPKSVPLYFGLDKTFALYFCHQYYYPS